jgi:N-acetyl-gamma-glutamyl-phosphate reductase
VTARIFIDGEAGTTGLQIRERLEGRRDIELLSIDPAKRKDADERKRLLNGVDAVIPETIALGACAETAVAAQAVNKPQINPETRVVIIRRSPDLAIAIGGRFSPPPWCWYGPIWHGRR